MSLALALLVASSTAAASGTTAADLPSLEARIDVDQLEFELSLPTERDVEQWRQPGFRVALGYNKGLAHGTAAAPRIGLDAAELRFGARLSERWSLMGTLQYALTRGPGGARFSGTVEPTLHVVEGLEVGVGLGMVVLLLPSYRRIGVETETLVATRTLDRDEDVLGACTGSGVTARLRVQYLFVLGERFATGPTAQTGLQWVGCEQDLDRTDPDTGESVRLRQFWAYVDWSLGWALAWR